MGKKSKTQAPPPAPDPYAVAAAQGSENRETAIANQELNMINQQTPYGSLRYDFIGNSAAGNPRYSATQTLSPDQQLLYNLDIQGQRRYGELANQQLGAVSNLLAQPIDFGQLGPRPEINEDTRQQVYQSIVDRARPEFDRREDALRTRLANMGFTDPDSEAYQAELRNFGTNLNDFELAAQQNALGQATQLYSAEQAQRNAALNELAQERAIPLNELTALFSGAQVTPANYVNTPQGGANPAPLADSIYSSYQGDLNSWQAQQQANAARNQGLFGLLGAGAKAAGMAWSDIRLKENIKQISTLPNGIGLYVYRYRWGGPEQIGVMAQEVEKIIPDAVIDVNGYKAVNYGRI